MGLTEDTQRTRLLGSRHRANHGYLPEHPSELGFAILADRRFRAARPEIELIDVAPTVLALLGEARPESMRGSIAFVR
jgi:bisphosphoglycerate-independent phosphoglycerate mutase (AlkP superfamily)